MTRSQITFSIIGHDSQTRSALAKLADELPDLDCVSQHADGRDALQKMPRKFPNIVLSEINLPDMDGIECVRRLKRRLPRTQFIIVTDCQRTEKIINAIAAGAVGYLFKPATTEELVQAIRIAHCGGSPINSVASRAIVQTLQRPASNALNQLSPQQTCVWELLSHGHRYKDIADRLGITYATVHTHIRHIYKKFQVTSRTEAVMKGFRERNDGVNFQSFEPEWVDMRVLSPNLAIV